MHEIISYKIRICDLKGKILVCDCQEKCRCHKIVLDQLATELSKESEIPINLQAATILCVPFPQTPLFKNAKRRIEIRYNQNVQKRLFDE